MVRGQQTFLTVVGIVSLWLASGELVPAVSLARATFMCCATTLVLQMGVIYIMQAGASEKGKHL